MKVVELKTIYSNGTTGNSNFVSLQDFLRYWFPYCPVKDDFFCDTEENRQSWYHDPMKFICQDPEPMFGGTDYIIYGIKTVKPDENCQVISLEDALKIKYKQI